MRLELHSLSHAVLRFPTQFRFTVAGTKRSVCSKLSPRTKRVCPPPGANPNATCAGCKYWRDIRKNPKAYLPDGFASISIPPPHSTAFPLSSSSS